MAAGNKVATIDCGCLADLLGDQIEVRKSQVNGKKYPLYLSTPIGPVPFNTRKAQDFLLERAAFVGPPVQQAPEPSQVPAPEPSQVPAPIRTPAKQITTATGDRSSIIEWLGDFGRAGDE